MATFKVKVNGEFEDEVFYSESDAVDHALYLASCTKEGAEILNMSNPGDYAVDDYDIDIKVVEFDDDGEEVYETDYNDL